MASLYFPSGGTKEVEGYVRTSDGSGMSEVNVHCAYWNGVTHSDTTTDSSGYYKLAGLPAGTYTVGIDFVPAATPF